MTSKSEYITFESNEITLRTTSLNRVARMILSILIIIGILLPIVASVFAVSENEEVKPTIILSFLIFWGVSYYLFRMLTWNLSGMEIITIMDNEYKIESKSKFIQFGTWTIEKSNTNFSVIPTRQRKLHGVLKQMGKLIVRNSDKTINLNLELPQNELFKILRILNKKE